MPRILLADDHSVVRYGIKLLLKNKLELADIDEAEDAESIMAQLRARKYDLIMLDINMPDTDSFNLMHHLKVSWPDTKILILTMNPESLYGKRFLQLGASGYLEKTAAEEQIIKAVQLILSGQRYISPALHQIISDDFIAGRSTNPFDKLSPREFQIALSLISGNTITEICEMMNIQYTTVSTHRQHIFEKLNIKDNRSLVKLSKVYGVHT